MSGVQVRVQDVGRVCTLADGQFDGVLLVRFSTPIIALVEFESVRRAVNPTTRDVRENLT
jgi:hypothetical protein